MERNVFERKKNTKHKKSCLQDEACLRIKTEMQIHGLSDCLAKGVKILDGMTCSPLFASIRLDTWESSGI